MILDADDLQGDDRRMVEAAQADPARFADLYQAHFYRVYAYVARRVGNRAHAEDVTSDVFRDALAGLPRFEWREGSLQSPFRNWLFRIAQHAVADHWRKLGREPNPVDEPVTKDDTERRALLFQLVDRLPEAQYRTIHMRFVEQKSIREIALEMDRSEGAIKQLQQRAIENLRLQWEESNAR